MVNFYPQCHIVRSFSHILSWLAWRVILESELLQEYLHVHPVSITRLQPGRINVKV